MRGKLSVMALTTSILVFSTFSSYTVGARAEAPNPPGLVTDFIPDPNLKIPQWTEPWTGPDIPLSFGNQTGTNFPEQIMITPATRDASYFFVTWLLPKKISRKDLGSVRFGTNSQDLDQLSRCKPHTYSYALKSSGEYTSGPIFHCSLGPLLPSTQYFYKVNGSQLLLNFTSLPRPGKMGTPKPLKFGLIADVGQSVNSSVTIDHVVAANVDFVLFAGDLSYADNYKARGCRAYDGIDRGRKTCGEGGVRWDSFGRLAQKLFSKTPVAFCPGNHEIEINFEWGESQPFKAYKARVPRLLDDKSQAPFGKKIRTNSMARKRRIPANSPMFYSLDIGNVHVISLSSYSAFTRYTHQDKFLQDDLCGIDRSITPWVVVMLHTPWYNSDVSHYLEGEPFRKMFEGYLFDAGVDLVIAGHVHAYERSFPVYDMRINECGPVYITVGDGGNDEGIAGPFLEPRPIYSVYREDSFGYAELDILSDTEARYTWFRNQNSSRVPSDSFVLENKFHKCGAKKPSFCRNSANVVA